MPERDLKTALLSRLRQRSATVCVAGMGYVGLPLAVAAAEAGHRVVGVDVDQDRVDFINAGRSPVSDVPDRVVAELIAKGRLAASTSYRSATSADVAVIAVPTPIDEYRVPDLSAVRRSVASLSRHVKPGALVILESTTYPGTSEEIIVPALRERGLRPGIDVFIGYSPERIDPGNGEFNLQNTPKVVSGFTVDCLETVIAFYGSFVQRLVPVSNLRTAEITKLFENIFRIVNIALANELQMICDGFGIDVWEVIEACSTKPFGFMPFYPGPGMGGHCVPVDPFYLAYKSREKNVNTEFIELAGRINAAMPRYVVGRISKLLNARQRSLHSARICLLGVSYKRNTSDVRESPAIKLVELLTEEGALVSYHDPHVSMLEAGGQRFRSQPLTADYLGAVDCAVVVTDHDDIDWTLVLQYSPMVLDTRNVLGRLAPDRQRGARLLDTLT